MDIPFFVPAWAAIWHPTFWVLQRIELLLRILVNVRILFDQGHRGNLPHVCFRRRCLKIVHSSRWRSHFGWRFCRLQVSRFRILRKIIFLSIGIVNLSSDWRLRWRHQRLGHTWCYRRRRSTFVYGLWCNITNWRLYWLIYSGCRRVNNIGLVGWRQVSRRVRRHIVHRAWGHRVVLRGWPLPLFWFYFCLRQISVYEGRRFFHDLFVQDWIGNLSRVTFDRLERCGRCSSFGKLRKLSEN